MSDQNSDVLHSCASHGCPSNRWGTRGRVLDWPRTLECYVLLRRLMVIPEKYLKAAVHGFLMGLGIVELFNCQSKARKFVLGSAVGWHAHATFYHLVLEKKQTRRNYHEG